MKNRVTAPTWAEINLDNINFNLNNIRKLLKEDTKICTVLKANAYGHGSVEIAKFLENKNVDYFAVARLEEAIELRENNIKMPILCLGFVPEESLEYALENNITLTIYSLEMAKKLNDISEKTGITANIHIKIDTGMSRIGFEASEESIDQIVNISNLNNLYIEGIYTHFAKSDEIDKDFTYKQADRFKFMVDSIEKRGINIPIKHVSNSAAIIDLPEYNFDMVRAGIMLYGLYPSLNVNQTIVQLKEVMCLKAKISFVKTIEANCGVSYGLKYKSKKEMLIATLPIGYADGYTRMLSEKAQVMVHKHKVPVIGNICMDQCLIDVSDLNVKMGDEVVLFGGNDSNGISITSVADLLNTINYEIVCMIDKRVPRVYIKNNKNIYFKDYVLITSPSTNHI